MDGVPHDAPPLGAHWDGHGVAFALFSAHAEKVELCLFGDDASEKRVALARDGDVWRGYVPSTAPGSRYGYRVHGPYAPAEGHRFNPHKLLIDPYAQALTGPVRWQEINHAHSRDDESRPDPRDNAAAMPKCVVTAPFGTAPPGPPRPWTDAVIYELHVKGFTRLHPGVPAADRGRFAGLAAPAIVNYLTDLGVTAVELLPVCAFADESHLAAAGLTNYWGYNTVNFFTPDPRYGTARDMRNMIAALHGAGIEVILDMVFNHTAEGDARGQCLSFRGIDNRSYYWLDDAGGYTDHSGCGNTLNAAHPRVRKLIIDSLVHWTAMGVDGFRFDLATVLGRGPGGFRGDAPLFSEIKAMPALRQAKFIAEPWDINGYHLGGFPDSWAEWNDRYRDTLRDYWRGADHRPGTLALCLAGSNDIFVSPARTVNFITAHDGFTLQDLVSFEAKHNEANGEHNRDGAGNNRSRNWGVEGPTSDPAIAALRDRQKRNFLACLLLSKGVPMLTAGDEMGRSQNGNNNAYCQDNAVSWIDWTAADSELQAFVKQLIRLRARTPVLRNGRFYLAAKDGAVPDIFWLHPDGREIVGEDWTDPGLTAFGFLLPSDGADLAILINGGGDIFFRLPSGPWTVRLDTAGARKNAAVFGEYAMTASSLAVLELQP